MSKLDGLVGRYRRQTDSPPPDDAEAKVLARVRARADGSLEAIISLPAFRPSAIAAGLVMGLISTALVPPTLAAQETLPELAVFAPHSSYLVTSSLGPSE